MEHKTCQIIISVAICFFVLLQCEIAKRLPLSVTDLSFQSILSESSITTLYLKASLNSNYHNYHDNAEHLLQRQSHAATYQICVIVRTHPRQANLLPITLLSLTQQAYFRNNDDVAMSLFVVNTDPKDYTDTAFMTDAAEDANKRAGYAAVTVLDSAIINGGPPDKSMYGYDVTDKILETLLVKNEGNRSLILDSATTKGAVAGPMAKSTNSTCTHFMFTNGDNFYNNQLVDSVIPSLQDGKRFIAWDFISHYKIKIFEVELKVQQIDLGAMLVDRRAIEYSGARFLPQKEKTTRLRLRDGYFAMTVCNDMKENDYELIHKVLFVHQ